MLGNKTLGIQLKTVLIAAACSLSLGSAIGTANADTGSAGEIRSAIRSNNADAIIGALEDAEMIMCPASCISEVMELVKHDEYRIREVASWWFARRPAQMNELADLASAWLTLEDSTDARNGADILGTFAYAKFIPVLSTAAVNAEFSGEARAAAVQALGHIGNMDANTVVAQAMLDTDASVRLKAVAAWQGMLKQKDAAPVAALVKDSDTAVRRSAMAAVGAFRTASARGDLEAALQNDSDAAVRRNAAWALGRIGDAASREVLQAAVNDPSSLVRMTARVAIRGLK